MSPCKGEGMNKATFAFLYSERLGQQGRYEQQ